MSERPDEPVMWQGSGREQETARRELARMPDDVRAKVRAVAARHGLTSVQALAWLIHDVGTRS